MYNRRFPGRPGPGPFGGNRFIGGGFLGPFLLGGITGGLLAPNFGPRPYPVPVPYGPPPFGIYPSFYY